MAFDGFITKSIVSELKKTIIGAKVNKIYVPNKNEVLLSLYNVGKNYNLKIICYFFYKFKVILSR